MKKILASVLLLVTLGCSKEFGEITPKGVISESSLATEEGVDLLLVGAYSMLDQVFPGVTNEY